MIMMRLRLCYCASSAELHGVNLSRKFQKIIPQYKLALNLRAIHNAYHKFYLRKQRKLIIDSFKDVVLRKRKFFDTLPPHLLLYAQ